jgi:hypothetical protein
MFTIEWCFVQQRKHRVVMCPEPCGGGRWGCAFRRKCTMHDFPLRSRRRTALVGRWCRCNESCPPSDGQPWPSNSIPGMGYSLMGCYESTNQLAALRWSHAGTRIWFSGGRVVL